MERTSPGIVMTASAMLVSPSAADDNVELTQITRNLQVLFSNHVTRQTSNFTKY